MKRTLQRNGDALFMVLMALVVVSCRSTEPQSAPPHINVSPEGVDLGVVERRGGVSIGLESEVNESDSLETLEALPGVLVRAVEASGAAAAAGIRPGDVILSIDGVATDDPDALAAVLRAAVDGGTLAARVRRATVVFEATMIARASPRGAPPPRELYRVDPVMSRAGYRTEIVAVDGARRPAARIVRFFPGSPLPARGLQAGDHLAAIDGVVVSSAQGVVRAFLEDHRPGDSVTLTVQRAGGDATVEMEIRLWEPRRHLTELTFLPFFSYEFGLAPSRTKFAFIDLWLFSLFSYERLEGEREFRILSLIRFATGYGELIEESAEAEGET